MNMKITRSKMEQLADPLLTRTKQPCLTSLKDAGVKKEDIDDVLLVSFWLRYNIFFGGFTVS